MIRLICFGDENYHASRQKLTLRNPRSTSSFWGKRLKFKDTTTSASKICNAYAASISSLSLPWIRMTNCRKLVHVRESEVKYKSLRECVITKIEYDKNSSAHSSFKIRAPRRPCVVTTKDGTTSDLRYAKDARRPLSQKA